MRFTLLWAMASTLPTTIETAAITHTNGRQSHWSGPKATKNTRTNAPKAATLVPADMNAVTEVGAPWYASGVHMWNGTAAILNANPVATSPAAAMARGRPPTSPDSLAPIPARLV